MFRQDAVRFSESSASGFPAEEEDVTHDASSRPTPWLVGGWRGRMLNIHPSLLPLYPGLDTHARAIAAGDAEAGCTVHLVTEGVDEGPILDQARVPVVVDAGIGAPSHAAEALEMGAAAVLVNTAIAVARDPIQMAHAFRMAVEAGAIAAQSGLGARHQQAQASSPLTQFLQFSQEGL